MKVEITSSVRDILNQYTFRNNGEYTILRLPVMTDKQYKQVKYLVEYIGGHWSEKNGGFKFKLHPDEAAYKLEQLMKLDHIELSDDKAFKIRNNFYPTPDWLAEKMVEMAEIKPGDFVLEPSAGRGHLLKYITAKTDKYDAVECNNTQMHHLLDLGYTAHYMTFEQYALEFKDYVEFDAIVMNPPFCDELDLRHIMLAYQLLKPGGRLVGLAAENSIYYKRPITDAFNEWLELVGGNVEEIPSGSFTESGTNVDVVLITITK